MFMLDMVSILYTIINILF